MLSEVMEVFTRILVIVLYAGALATAIRGLSNVKLWSRKVSLIAISATSGVWILFYLFLIAHELDRTHPPTLTALLSRIAHYVAAAGLYIMAYLILESEQVHGHYDE